LEFKEIINTYKQIYTLNYIQYLQVLGIVLVKIPIQRGFIMKLVDSHCHLNFPDLVNNLDNIFNRMIENNVVYALCVSVDLDSFLDIKKICDKYKNNSDNLVEELVNLSKYEKVVAIGETGLDFFKQEISNEQCEKFSKHIQASNIVEKPLIIHTRSAPNHTLNLLKEGMHANHRGGVMHCFTETYDFAKKALDLNFYISFSGIITFKNANDLRETVKKIPLDKILIETDSPYLAPVPYRGKTNEPSYVYNVAQMISELKNISIEEVAEITSNNFCELFSLNKSILQKVS